MHRVPAILLAAAVTCAAGCKSIPSSADAAIRYDTVASPWPEGRGCLNKPVKEGVAKEVLMGSTLTVVVASGSSPISDTDWETYSPSFGNQKNSSRHLLFNTSCFARSPGAPVDCEGAACGTVVELDGHTWMSLSKVEAADCVPAAGGCSPSGVLPNQLAFVVTRKCHEMTFNGPVIFLRGPAGEKAVMHATADGNPTTEVALPAGWSLAKEELPAPLVLHPFGGGAACFYNIIRDNRAQSYHQFEYAKPTYP